MFTDPAEIIQTGLDKAEKVGEANEENENPDKERDSSPMLRQPRHGLLKHKNTLATKTTPTEKPHSITSPLSGEDLMVKVKNPDLDQTSTRVSATHAGQTNERS